MKLVKSNSVFLFEKDYKTFMENEAMEQNA